MLKSIKRTIGSGGVKFNVTLNFEGVGIEQIQQDAANYYVWKLQRVIRDADEKSRSKFLSEGINIHVNEVGKTIVTTEQLVSKMSDDQALQAYELLKAKLGK
jgi:hypothetical protein